MCILVKPTSSPPSDPCLLPHGVCVFCCCQAMAALDEKHLIDGSTTPLAVKWADPLLQIKKRRAVEDSNAENRMVSALPVLSAYVPPSYSLPAASASDHTLTLLSCISAPQQGGPS